MKRKQLILLFVCASFLVAGSVTVKQAQGNNAYRYYMLYKNSETYRKIHDIEEETPDGSVESEGHKQEQEQEYENDEQYLDDSSENPAESMGNGPSSTWHDNDYGNPSTQ